MDIKNLTAQFNNNTLLDQYKNQTDKSIRIIAFGSSNTELSWHSEGRHNWVDWLSIRIREQIGQHIQVINQGIGGNNSEQLLNRVERDVLSFKPVIVIITIAGNDAQCGFTNFQYENNLRKLCVLLMENEILPVLQTYYCPVYIASPNGFEEKFKQFMDINRSLAEELCLPLIDQYSFFEPLYRNAPDIYAELMLDWLHLSYYGNFIMGLNVARAFGMPDFPAPLDIKEKVDIFLEEFKMHRN